MYDVNRVHVAGRITSVAHKETKTNKKFLIVGLVTNRRTNGKMECTFISAMVFKEVLIEYLEKIGVGKGYFCIIEGYLSNTRIGNVRNAISVIANDINVVVKVNGDEPTTENAILEDIDFDEYDI